jgi:threonine/homoserine/homoserine lactone efflux protein
VIGNTLGLIAQVVGVALGLGALVAASASAYTVLKLVGAAYVIYLGVQAIRHRAAARLAMEAAEGEVVTGARPSTLASVWTGFMVGMTNPRSRWRCSTGTAWSPAPPAPARPRPCS